MSETKQLQINWVNSAGGALGAVSSAVVLSSLGAAGTLAGAAVGSLCITVGGAIYSHYLAITKERVATQALAAARRGGRARSAVSAGAAAPEGHHRDLGEPGPADGDDQVEDPDLGADHVEDPDHAEDSEGLAGVLGGLPWKRIGLISAALFLVSMALIVAFELSTGRAVSTYTGGTSNTSVGTSVPGFSGTGQDSPGSQDEGQTPVDDSDGTVSQEQDEDESAPQDGGEAPAEEAPAEEAPAGEAPAEEAPAEEAPAEEAPVEPAPVEPAPAEPAPEAPAE